MPDSRGATKRSASPRTSATACQREINRLLPRKFNAWASKREWIPVMLETANQPRKLLLKLDVDESNIDYLERAPCEEIIAQREREYQESCRKIPRLEELLRPARRSG